MSEKDLDKFNRTDDLSSIKSFQEDALKMINSVKKTNHFPADYIKDDTSSDNSDLEIKKEIKDDTSALLDGVKVVSKSVMMQDAINVQKVENEPLIEEPKMVKPQMAVPKRPEPIKSDIAPASTSKKRKSKKNSKEVEPDFEGYKTISRTFQVISIIIFALILVGIGIYLLVIPRASGKLASENRNYVEFPQISFSNYLDGTLTGGITDYYTDTIPSREKLKVVAKRFESFYGFSIDDTQIIGNKGNIKKQTFDTKQTITTAAVVVGNTTAKNTETTKAATTATTTKATTTKTTTAKSVIKSTNSNGRMENGIILTGFGKNVRALEGYAGGFSYGTSYAKYVSDFKKRLGSNINVYSMCIPTAAAFYLPANMKHGYANTIDDIRNIRKSLIGVIDVPTYEELYDHTDEKIYSRTDHHWQSLGAYYAVNAFSKVGEFDLPSLSEYKKIVKKNYVGTMYYFSGSEEVANAPEDFIYYKAPNANKVHVRTFNTSFGDSYVDVLFNDNITDTSSYYMTFGGDECIKKISTTANTNRTLVIFKDSFGNAIAPLLTSSFKTIYVCDTRYFDLNAISFVKQVKATDVLFATCMFSCTTAKADYINNIMNQ